MRAHSQSHHVHPAHSTADVASTLWMAAVCAIFGHAKVTSDAGDWSCLRCGKLRCAALRRPWTK